MIWHVSYITCRQVHCEADLGCLECLVSEFEDALSMHEWKDALWAKFFTGAPSRQRQSVEQYKIVNTAH